ncbi:MAG: hypothetical protein N4A63_10855 [Vallitalea sp.]|jgi:tetratricopeptide (TPR) repeat protein|nr:hypothetical protein [Vallitalea sp.]
MNIKKGIITGALIATISMTSLTGVNASTKQTNNEYFKEFSQEFKTNISKEDYKKAESYYKEAMNLTDEANKYYDQLYKLDLFDDEMITEAISIDETCSTICEEMSFKEFAKGLKKDIKDIDYKKAKELFEKIMKLEKENKYEEANKLWDNLFKMDIFDFADIINIDEVNNANVTVTESIQVNENANTIENITEAIPFTFEDFAKDFKKDIKDVEYKEAKKLYEKAIELEESKKYEEASKLWDKLFNMDIFDFEGDIKNIDDNIMDLENVTTINLTDNSSSALVFTFEEFSKEFKKGIKPKVIEEAKDLFEKYMKAEEEAIKIWDKLNKMDIYKAKIR